uniref:Uncharacterized protein n=1 Tax=Oncorhynchus mykiss TaxID=8022 RepID=A0A8K9UQJ2_ONCMY
MFGPKPTLRDRQHLYQLIIGQLLDECYTNVSNSLIPEVKTYSHASFI